MTSFVLWVSLFAVPQDKVDHLTVSAFSQAFCTTITKAATGEKFLSNLTCLINVNMAGALKEVADPYIGGHRDKKDMIANFLGSGNAFLMIQLGF